jgi:hypothetical protein
MKKREGSGSVPLTNGIRIPNAEANINDDEKNAKMHQISLETLVLNKICLSSVKVLSYCLLKIGRFRVTGQKFR